MKSEQRKEIQELIAILTDEHLTEIEVERNGFRIRIRRDFPVASGASPPPVSPAAPPPARTTDATVEAADSADADWSQFLTVTSPMVGTFYRSPSPEAECYVEEGSIVRKGQTLCVIEAMKLMNEIEAEADGRVVRVLVENGTGVEYGQRLFVIDPLPVV